MLLVAGPSPELVKFIQIVCWIVLPVLLSAVLITAYMHYRKKKDEKKLKTAEDGFMQASPELVGYTKGDGEYILFDHSNLIQEYKNRLLYNHAWSSALQKDFSAMETKYLALATYIKTIFSTTKKEGMENLLQQMPQHLKAEVNKLAEDHAAEKKELLARLEHLDKSCQRLEQENISLQEQLSMGTATGDERNAIIKKWKEENTLLRDKCAEQEYLADVVEEKKAQLIFLQNQLEQRIKNLYQSEHLRLKAIAELKQAREEMDKQAESLKNELLLKQEEADKTQITLCAKEEQLTEKLQVINSKTEHITQLENLLHESKEQNEVFKMDSAGSREMITVLQQELLEERSKVQLLEQKLLDNRQTMRKLYKEFSACMEEESERSPVIALRPEYANEESAV